MSTVEENVDPVELIDLTATSSNETIELTSNEYLVGDLIHQICSPKLPSNKEVLSVLLHNKLSNKHKESVKLVVEEVMVFWRKSRIPTKSIQRCEAQVEKLFAVWKKLRKNQKRDSKTQKCHEKDFCEKFNDLFDISHANALKIMKIPIDRDFLLQQRQKGRPGHMVDIPDNIVKSYEKRLIRADQERKRKEKWEKEKNTLGKL